ncbi:acyltransferase [Variovorax paradoxus]|uniref:acyltransferase n=1 Tax=Variovorax paradoxus TaxID=34073 RepID=UPI003ED16B4B
MRKFLTALAINFGVVLKVPLLLFFDARYLSGRFFDQDFLGFYWCIKAIWTRNILRLAPPRPFPAALTCRISKAENIDFHPDDLNNFQSPGTYFQNLHGRIVIGRGSYIGPNVGLITANHRLDDLDKHEPGMDIVLGKRCWIGMNAVVMPGVVLGDDTIVAAGAIVTKSFASGAVIIGGVPAKVLKTRSL